LVIILQGLESKLWKGDYQDIVKPVLLG